MGFAFLGGFWVFFGGLVGGFWGFRGGLGFRLAGV